MTLNNPTIVSGSFPFAGAALFGVLVLILLSWQASRRESRSWPESWIPSANADLLERLGCYCAAAALRLYAIYLYRKGDCMKLLAKCLLLLVALLKLQRKFFERCFNVVRVHSADASSSPNAKLRHSAPAEDSDNTKNV